MPRIEEDEFMGTVVVFDQAAGIRLTVDEVARLDQMSDGETIYLEDADVERVGDKYIVQAAGQDSVITRRMLQTAMEDAATGGYGEFGPI